MEESRPRTVAEAHAELYHYTTAEGIYGIIRSQQLWATNADYLNDSEEVVGFFSRRLPVVLLDAVTEAVDELVKSEPGRHHVESLGGRDKAINEMRAEAVRIVKETTLELCSPFITSFCSASRSEVRESGLLSQWRGYGRDGGYAVEFDTVALEKMLLAESSKFLYQLLVLADVEYYDGESKEKAIHPEALQYERIIQSGIREFIVRRQEGAFKAMFPAVPYLASVHKHHGFREEAEVRIVAITLNSELREMAINRGDARKERPIGHLNRKGTLVPYLALFGEADADGNSKLPIKRIIVGPHPDRYLRQKSLQLLLDQNDVDAVVSVSDIPYNER